MRRSLVVWGLLAGPVTTCAALAAPAGFTSPTPGARLEGGQTIAVEWVSDGPVLTAFDESELLLSLDGGATFPLRVTRQIAPETHRLLWRVPAFPTRNAHLALRIGSRSTPDTETIRFVSAEFSIEPQPRAPLEDTFFVAGEWRTRDAIERPDSPIEDPGVLNRAQEERMTPGPAKPVVAESRPDRFFERPECPPTPAPPGKPATTALFSLLPAPLPQALFPKRE